MCVVIHVLWALTILVSMLLSSYPSVYIHILQQKSISIKMAFPISDFVFYLEETCQTLNIHKKKQTNTVAIQTFVAKASMLILRPVMQSSKVKARLERVS